MTRPLLGSSTGLAELELRTILSAVVRPGWTDTVSGFSPFEGSVAVQPRNEDTRTVHGGAVPITRPARTETHCASADQAQMVTPKRFLRAKAKTMERMKKTMIQWVFQPRNQTSASS
jgi:hypothetical protein